MCIARVDYSQDRVKEGRMDKEEDNMYIRWMIKKDVLCVYGNFLRVSEKEKITVKKGSFEWRNFLNNYSR